MDDERLRTGLDRLVPSVRVEKGWDDVVERAGRLRRRHDRRRRAAVALVACALVLAAALAASGQIGSLLSHSKEPHLVLRGQVRATGATPVGTIEIELHRAAVSFGRRVALIPWGRGTDLRVLPARWFLDVKEGRGNVSEASLYTRRSLVADGGRLARLCAPCREQDSGRIEFSPAQAYALVNDDVVLVLTRAGRTPRAEGLVHLDRTYLRRGIECRLISKPRRSCRRIYTGLS